MTLLRKIPHRKGRRGIVLCFLAKLTRASRHVDFRNAQKHTKPLIFHNTCGMIKDGAFKYKEIPFIFFIPTGNYA